MHHSNLVQKYSIRDMACLKTNTPCMISYILYCSCLLTSPQCCISHTHSWQCFNYKLLDKAIQIQGFVFHNVYSFLYLLFDQNKAAMFCIIHLITIKHSNLNSMYHLTDVSSSWQWKLLISNGLLLDQN